MSIKKMSTNKAGREAPKAPTNVAQPPKKQNGWTAGMEDDSEEDLEAEDLVRQFGSGLPRTPSRHHEPSNSNMAPAASHQRQSTGIRRMSTGGSMKLKRLQRSSSSAMSSGSAWSSRLGSSFKSRMRSFDLRLFSSWGRSGYHPWRTIGKSLGAVHVGRWCGFKCGPSEEFYDKNPRQGVLFSTFVYALPIGGAVLVVMATEATIASKGLLLLASFAAIRDTTAALGQLFSFFWFFEMAATGKLVAEHNWNAVGGHMALSTLASLTCGIAGMLSLIFLAEPLLNFLSPPADRAAVLSIALHPTRIAAASIPFAVYNFASAGLLLGAKVIAKTVGSFFFWGIGTAIAIISALLRLDCSTEERVNCPAAIVAQLEAGTISNDACVLTYDDDGFVCSGYKDFLSISAAVLACGSAGVALSLFVLQMVLISPHGVNFTAAMQSHDVWKDWSRDTMWVAVRSIVGNSRHFVALALALRMGIAESAAFLMFGSLSQIAYAIPSNLASVAMITISRLIGRRNFKAADQVLDDYRTFGLACGVLFCIVAAFSKDGLIESYSKEAEEQALRDVISPIWWWVLAYQPARSLLAVYQALIAGNQNFAYWGKSTVVATVFVFAPTVTIAAIQSRVEMLIIGEVLWTYVLFVLLYAKVHWLKSGRPKHEHEDIVEDLSEDEFYGRGAYANGDKANVLEIPELAEDEPPQRRGALEELLKGSSSGSLQDSQPSSQRGRSRDSI